MFARAAAFTLLSLFSLLVAFGITGSSFHILPSHTSTLISSDSSIIAGSARLNRPDDWAVMTPMAIAQVHHDPRFPISNENLGVGGHNMLVVGMVGVPVAHISALAKPATWGFFFLDLKRALAWQWWMPLFGSLLALWHVMHILLPHRPALGLATSLAFLTSSYVAAWSIWPAYAVFFPAVALCLAHSLTRSTRWWICLLLAFMLGTAIAGFVLILYPPWQVSVGSLFVLLAVGVAWRERLWLRLNVPRLGCVTLALMVTAGILFFWWQDAAPAIRALQATIYPGQRLASTGGNIPLWQFIEGFLNHYTLYSEGVPGTNPSENASFLYLFPVALFALLFSRTPWREQNPIVIALLLLCVWVVWFQFAGIFPGLAKWSQWGRVPDYRADLSLGLASMLLCAFALARPPSVGPRTVAGKLSVAAIWALIIIWGILTTPAMESGPVPAYLLVAASLLAFMLSYWLLERNARAFFLALIGFCATASLPFNPLAHAPSSVSVQIPLLQNAQQAGDRVLVTGRHIEAMALLAAGVPVANGVFYHPPQLFWQMLDPENRFAAVSNRFQHLIFLPETSDEPAGYRAESPQDDVVVVYFDSARFDFRTTGASLVLAPDDSNLGANSTLQALERHEGYRLYRVRATTPSPQQ